MTHTREQMQTMPLYHFRSPCVHCELLMEDVAIGPCRGDPLLAVPMAWVSLGVRWDGVEHFKIQMSNGDMLHRWEHIDMGLAYGYLMDARYDERLRR